MFGQTLRFLGPVHGYVGNAQALLELAHVPSRRKLERSANEVLARAAVVEKGLANWPPIDRPNLESLDGAIRVQCVTEPPEFSRPPPTISTRSWFSQARSSPGGRARTGTSVDPRSATGRPGTAMGC